MAASEIGKWQTQLAEDAGISLSAVAKQIRAQVTRPQRQRDPVGYKDAFLDDYQPNQSAYLSESIRQDLAQEGHVGASQLPAGTYVRKVLDRLLIDLSWNSSRLEGNTYSILETQRLLELGEASDGKATVEAQMLLNHKAAIELLADQADEIGFNHYTICNLHALLADNLMPDPDSCGRIRERSVGIAASVYYPPEGHLRIKERFDVFLEKAEAIENPFEQAFFAMVHLPYLQAFEDVNKRVSRLAANIPLVRHNLCPLSFVDVPQSDYVHAILGVYELNRIEYLREVFVWAYKRSAMRYSAVRETLGEPDPFRLQHRHIIHACVREIVQQNHSQAEASSSIEAFAHELAPDARAQFIQVIQVELNSLHEGNIARYRLRPREFAAWQGHP
ncbi:Fic family protein [Coraliomargarita algicola]|uniref:Fic family protein n=1 Tax=Coraliomargarita algicola TaxID=3092156 RepID=A0ABZ0RJ47_9BACT|nr:Fic family protein [Coraliomargarita sp. J2-16]WPJ95493.1 Fic family protein [Coraliomargarita sp. J2-16]